LPSTVPFVVVVVVVIEIGGVFNPLRVVKLSGLRMLVICIDEHFANGVTRLTDFADHDVLCGFVRGGRGRAEGVYGIDVLAVEDAGVWDREGALLNAAWEVEERL